MNNFIAYLYAASVGFSQCLVTFSQIRAEQEALSKMTDKQIQALTSSEESKPAIGFNRA